MSYTRAAAYLEPHLTATRDIQVLKTYGAAPYAAELKKLEKEIKDKQQMINEKIGRCSLPQKYHMPLLTSFRRQGSYIIHRTSSFPNTST